jgi:phosphopantothenoylcysteine synthetase/decarboxylase
LFGVKGSGDICMSVKALEEKRRRLRSQGWDLDIVDKVRLQRLREEEEKERETGDIYDDKQREEMLEADAITAAENAFMQGRKKTDKR